jgi:hypothetical protein
MKKVFLSSALCLLAFSFIKAQGTSLAATKPTFDVLKTATDTLNLDAYCGVYKMQENEYVDKVKIMVKDGHLVSKSPDDDEVIFVQTKADEFFVSQFNLYALFVKIDGIVKSVKVRIQGKEVSGDKL